MADRYITDLPAATSIQDSDALLVDQSSVARMITGSLLKNYINRNILSITVNTGASTDPARVVSYNAQSGALVLEIPKGIGIKSITAGPTSGLQRTYVVTYDDDTTDNFVVYDGNGISSVVLTSGDHSPGTLDTYTINFTNGTSSNFYVYNGKDGEGSPSTYVSPSDSATGSLGSLLRYAREDHSHPANAKKVNITIPASWTADTGGAFYTQDVTSLVTAAGATLTANSKVDLQGDATALLQLVSDAVSALFVDNNNGTLTAYAVGNEPTAALSVQAVVIEVR